MIHRSIPQDECFSNTKKALYELPKPFHIYKDKKIWLASNENKKPVSPITGRSDGWNKPEAWGTYSDLEAHLNININHIPAIALSKECGLVAFDLDNVIDDKGNVLQWAQTIIDKLAGAYIEKSTGGKGFHIFVKGSKPGSFKVKTYPDDGKLEIYDSDKVMRVTGLQYSPCDQLADISPIIAEIYHTLFSEREEPSKTTYNKSSSFSDEEIIGFARIHKIKDTFKHLFDEGDISENGNDASAADFALIGILKFYTQDEEQLDRIMRRSKLKRPKWDSERGEVTWLRFSIRKALESVKETFLGSGTCSDSSQKTTKEATWNNPSKIEENDNLDLEFPVKELPDVLRNAVMEISTNIKVDPALVVLPGLGITSLMIGKKAIVIEKPGLKQQASLLLIGVAASGERKSATFDYILDDIKAEIDTEVEPYEKEKAAVRAHNELIKEEASRIKTLVRERDKDKKISSQEAEKLLQELYASEKKLPPEPHNFGGDITGPRLFQKICDHGGAYGVFSSDGRSVIKKILGTKDGDSDESIYLSGMWGDDLDRSRVGSNKGDVGGEDIRIRKPALTTVVFIQPDLWEDFSKDSKMRVSGLISRVNLVIPTSQMGTRFETAEDLPLNKSKITPFTDTIIRIRKWKPDKQVEILLDKHAAESRREFYNSIEKELKAGGAFDDCTDIATKATSIAARIALNIAVLTAAADPGFNGNIPPISKEQWLQAQAMEEYFLAQAIDSQRTHGKTGTVHILQKIATWLKKQIKQHVNKELPLYLLASQIAKGIRGTKTSDIEEKIIPVLIAHKWLKPAGTARGGKPKYEINPRIVDAKV